MFAGFRSRCTWKLLRAQRRPLKTARSRSNERPQFVTCSTSGQSSGALLLFVPIPSLGHAPKPCRGPIKTTRSGLLTQRDCSGSSPQRECLRRCVRPWLPPFGRAAPRHARRRSVMVPASLSPWGWRAPQALIQVEYRLVDCLPGHRGPQVQGVAARAAAEAVPDVLAQVRREASARRRLRPARPTSDSYSKPRKGLSFLRSRRKSQTLAEQEGKGSRRKWARVSKQSVDRTLNYGAESKPGTTPHNSRDRQYGEKREAPSCQGKWNKLGV
jgi:hypothetical protein